MQNNFKIIIEKICNIIKNFHKLLSSFIFSTEKSTEEKIKTEKYVEENFEIGNVYTLIHYSGFWDKWKIERLRNKYLTIKRQVYNPNKKRYEEEIIQLMVEYPEKKVFVMLTGFLPLIGVEYPKKHLELIDKKKLYNSEIWKILRDYQKQAVEEILREPRGIFEGVMGAGKTIIMVAICTAIKSDIPILVIIPKSQALLEQTVKVFLKFFTSNEIGWNYGKGMKYGRIMISSPGCLYKLSLNYYQAVLVDECHSIPAKTISKALYQMHNAVIRYGFSGTPVGRSDKMDFLTIGLLGKIFDYKVQYKNLEELGYVAKCKYITIHFNSGDLLDRDLIYDNYDITLNRFAEENYINRYELITGETNDWNKIVEYFVVNNKTRNLLILSLIHLLINKLNRNCLVIVERIKHGEILSKLIKEKFPSLRFEFIYSQRKDITKVIENFRNGTVQLLIATQLIEFGIDLPNLNSIILASIGKSSIQLLQRIGRGLRPKQGEILYVFDFCDKAIDSLERHFYLRKKWIQERAIDISSITINNLQDLRNFVPTFLQYLKEKEKV